jgi:hypothetical protein
MKRRDAGQLRLIAGRLGIFRPRHGDGTTISPAVIEHLKWRARYHLVRPRNSTTIMAKAHAIILEGQEELRQFRKWV